MSNITQLKSATAFVSDAKVILEEAIAQEFDTVIVFGFHKNKTCTVKASSIESNLTLMGAIEAAKQQIWGNA